MTVCYFLIYTLNLFLCYIKCAFCELSLLYDIKKFKKMVSYTNVCFGLMGRMDYILNVSNHFKSWLLWVNEKFIWKLYLSLKSILKSNISYSFLVFHFFMEIRVVLPEQ